VADVSPSDARSVASIFDPQRLRIARQLRKITRTRLAQELDVSAAAVGQWEAGATRPKPQTLVQIARTLRFPIEYFAASGRPLPDFDTESSFFRSLRKSSQIDREAAMAHAALLADLTEVIEQRARLPVLDIPEHLADESCSGPQIDEIARRVRASWDLKDEPIGDMVRLLEVHGAIVVRLELADQGIDAFSWLGPDRPFVILDTGKGNRARSRFDAAHELGHLVMHRERAKAADRDLEKQAHRFASAFLLPARQLEAEWPTGRLNWRELLKLKQRWQVSLAALLYRARDIELISPATYESAVKYMSRAGWRKLEPGDLGPPERPRLLRRAVQALEANDISMDSLADLAHIPVQEVRTYLTVPGSSARVSVEF
jgi:Zn-dependent peptidase ImmA (M78 family)/transcriptional regulator with XRE-family HTH domain